MLLIKLFVFVRKKSFDFFHVFGLESVDSEFSNLSVFDYLRTMNREIGSSGWSSMADPFILWISLSYDFPWPPPDFLWIIKKELHDTLNSSAGVFFVPVFISRFHLHESIFDCLICVLHSGKVIVLFSSSNQEQMMAYFLQDRKNLSHYKVRTKFSCLADFQVELK